MNPELLAFIAGGLTVGSIVLFIAVCWTSSLRAQIHELEASSEAAWSVAGYRKDEQQ